MNFEYCWRKRLKNFGVRGSEAQMMAVVISAILAKRVSVKEIEAVWEQGAYVHMPCCRRNRVKSVPLMIWAEKQRRMIPAKLALGIVSGYF